MLNEHRMYLTQTHPRKLSVLQSLLYAVTGLSKEFDGTADSLSLTRLWNIIEKTLNSIGNATNLFKNISSQL